MSEKKTALTAFNFENYTLTLQVVIVMLTLARRKREWSVRPLAAMGRPEAEVITKPEVIKSGNESWPEVTLKMRIQIKKKQMKKLLKMRPSLLREKKVHQVKFMFSKKATNINEISTSI